jgi:rhomboid family GlyGly-CTERM serine protease
MRLHKSWTAALVVGVLVIYCVPDLGPLLVYDRAAIADGQVWRLASGSFVHFSTGHLVSNLTVIAIAGWIIESHYRAAAPVLYGLCTTAIGTALYATDPLLVQFGGASGLAYAALTYLAMRKFAEPRWRPACIALLAAIGVKLFSEYWWGWSLVELSEASNIAPVPLSHTIGVAAALVLYFHHRRSDRASDWRTHRPQEAAAQISSSRDKAAAA